MKLFNVNKYGQVLLSEDGGFKYHPLLVKEEVIQDEYY